MPIYGTWPSIETEHFANSSIWRIGSTYGQPTHEESPFGIDGWGDGSKQCMVSLGHEGQRNRSASLGRRESVEESQGRKDHGIPATYESMATKPWLRKHGWAEGMRDPWICH